MKVCLPVKSDNGLQSIVFNHFGSAPYYAIFDSETEEITAVGNAHSKNRHEHGQCNPLKAFAAFEPEIVVVGAIGKGALEKLRAAGVKVFKAEGETVQENINLITSQGLAEYAFSGCCHGHHHGEGHQCGH